MKYIEDFHSQLKGLRPSDEALSVAVVNQPGGGGDALSARQLAKPRQHIAVQSTNNVTIAAAPGAGKQYAIISLIAQNLTATDSSFILKNAASGSTQSIAVPASQKGAGIGHTWGAITPLYWPENTPLVGDIAALVGHQITLQYLLLDVATGNPE